MSTKASALSERRVRKGTAEKLLQAAVSEFNEHGFDGTDTNRIARRAGFAPQTFYRWFQDKVEIFIKVYEHWQQEEVAVLRKLLADKATDARLVQACVAHHRAYLLFRRSLRRLSIENPKVRAARARSRLAQIGYLRSMAANRSRDIADLAATLLQFERLSDALAEGEFADMGLDGKAGEEALILLLQRLRKPARRR
jgi:AcrR family transcriptional regulator